MPTTLANAIALIRELEYRVEAAEFAEADSMRRASEAERALAALQAELDAERRAMAEASPFTVEDILTTPQAEGLPGE